MNDRDLTLRRRNSAAETSFFAIPNLLYGFHSGAIGGVVNAFLGISFFGSFTIYLGQVFVLLCLVLKGINAAIIAVAISSIFTAVNAGDPYLIIILALEVIIVHVLLKRGLFLLQSVMLYWACIGIPLLLLLSSLTTNISAQVLFINGLTLAINGLVCVSLAAIVCWLLPSEIYRHQYDVKPPKLASVIFSLCMLTVTLPALLISLFFIYQSSNQNEASINQNLRASAVEMSQVINRTLEAHIQSLATLSSFVSNGGSLNEARQILASIPSEHVNFSSTLILDSAENVVAVGPSRLEQRLKLSAHQSLIRNPSFADAKRDLQDTIYANISVEFIPGDRAIVMLRPIVNDQNYAGMAVGIMALPDFASKIKQAYKSATEFMIIDAEKNVISSSLAHILLTQKIDMDQQNHPLIKSIPMLSVGDDLFLYHQIETEQGWSIISLTSPSQSTANMMDNFFILLICSTFLLISFGLIANQLSRKITRPLEDIAEHFPDKAMHPSLLDDAKISIELVTLAERLVSSHAVMNDFHQQLSEQVDNKTRQLKQLNRELYSLAQKDSLTQLLNRAGFNRFALTSYRNCVRNRIKMSLILIDIDHFKVINDTHGHPFGDKCIVRVSEILQKHCKRDTDIIGRHGGEEFIIMIIGGETSEHHERMQLIKESISQARLKHNETEVKMTVSAGILSVAADYGIDFESMIKLADDQLYLSKRTGRNKISILTR
ncbi:diguanylate cyclase [Glaciecola sp. SC05]|uniref:diguanylate cyclase n=1 Tax=Glaciecola sp. SC05 TaxID=1987355 RepID=UPI003527A5AC